MLGLKALLAGAAPDRIDYLRIVQLGRRAAALADQELAGMPFLRMAAADIGVQRLDAVDQANLDQKVQRAVHRWRRGARVVRLQRLEDRIGADGLVPVPDDPQDVLSDFREAHASFRAEACRGLDCAVDAILMVVWLDLEGMQQWHEFIITPVRQGPQPRIPVGFRYTVRRGRDRFLFPQHRDGLEMQIIRDLENVPGNVRRGVVVLGNFDGVHRGHQAVIGQGGDLSRGEGIPLVVLTFEPHPRTFFRPHDPPFRLTPIQNKAHHIEALGVDALIVLTFDKAMSQLEAEEFVQTVLIDGLAARHVVVGQDFRFGRKRGGDIAMLETIGERAGFAVTTVSPVASADAEIYSSSHIREQLETGKPGHAAAMLGRPFEIEGIVEDGDKRGRTLGFPTANIAIGDYIRPARGVYAVRAGIEAEGGMRWVDGVANFGNRPTIGGDSLLLEVHLFDFNEDLYGRDLRVALIEYLRPERKFAGLDELKAQIDEDCATARRVLTVRAAGAS